MSRIVPRIHAFEIDDQTWFPSFLRERVQTALGLAWNFKMPILQSSSPAERVAHLLTTHLHPIDDYGFIDFCAGAGGPTPAIEKYVNAVRDGKKPAIPFVLTDLNPHVPAWKQAATKSSNIAYVADPVDAAAAPAFLLDRFRGSSESASTSGGAGLVSYAEAASSSHSASSAIRPRPIFRLFNLAFHHFPDPLAKAILADTARNSDGFGIFELQDRTFSSFVMISLFWVAAVIVAPFYALLNRDPLALIFTWFIPVIPFVLTFDGYISSLRTRTPTEVEALLRSCGVDGTEKWEIKSGSERHMWPFGYLEWIICTKKPSEITEAEGASSGSN